MSRFEGGLHSLKANPSTGTNDQNSRHARSMLVSDPPLIVMCNLGGRIARWMGFEHGCRSTDRSEHEASTPMSAFGPKRTIEKARLMSLSGVKRTCPFALHMSAYDPKRTFCLCAVVKTGGSL
jgi:hypothetical protein